MKVYIVLLAILGLSISDSIGQNFNLLPTIPDYANNPQAAVMWKGVQLTNPPFTTILTPALYDEVLYAAMSYFHPQSPYYHNSLALKRTNTLLDSMLTAWSNNLNTTSFNYTVEATYAYLLLKTYLPDSIPSNRKSIWEKGITNLITSTMKKPLMYDSLLVGSVWLNGDIRFAIAVVLGGTAIGDTASVAKARNVVENVMTKCLLEDGGTHYYGYQNENITYHIPTKKCFLIYWLFTQNNKVLNVLKGMKNYPLLMHHPVGKGFGEYIATPAWKPYYNSITLEYTAAISAFLTDDPYSWTLGKNAKAFELAFIWKNGLKSLPIPTNLCLFDKNIIGPRYRNGNWGAVGTMRDMASALPEFATETNLPIATLMAGKTTFAGAYALTANANATTYPLNAVFQAAAFTIKNKTGKETDYNRGMVNSFLSAFENNGITKTRSIYGLSTRYKVVDRVMNKSNFDGMQQWVFTQDRIIGMLEIEAMANTTCYGIGTRFCFVGGRLGVSGKYKPLVRLNDSTYQYGLLNFKIIKQDFNGKTDSVYYGIQGAANDTLSNQLILHDQLDSLNDKKINISKGYRKKVLVEVTKSTNSFANEAIVLKTTYPLYGFQFVENNNRKLRIVQNVSATPINYTDTFYCNYNTTRILKSWNEVDSSVMITNAKSILPINFTIPAYSHILIINSSIPTDTILGFNTFDTLFVGSSILPINQLKLEGNTVNCKTKISLTVNNETNVHSYQLQGSYDGNDFRELTTISTLYNTVDTISKYDFDLNPSLVNFPFFRIKSISKDGNSNYSKVLFVANDCNKADNLTIYPNPTKGNTIVVDYINSSNTSIGSIRLVNFLGTTVFKKEIDIAEGKNHYSIPISHLSNGQYYIQFVLTKGNTITKPINIIR